MAAEASGSGAAWAQAGITAIMGISSGITQQGQIDANNIVSDANAYAQNLVRSANNELKASRAGLARYNQSVNNQRTLENTGSTLEAATINYRRARDSAMSDDFESQIAFSEQAGAQAAAAALSGLTGGVADMVNGTTALRKARLQQRSDESMKQGDWDAGQRAKNILLSGWDSLDNSEIAADMDYSVDIATKQVRAGGLVTDILGGQDTKNLANMAADTKNFFKSSSFNDYWKQD